jgi:sugar lactone lactonase YvrE
MKSKALVACGSLLILGGALLSSCGNSQSPNSPPNATPTPTATTTIRVNAGAVITLAGQSVGGSVNATGTASSFSGPEGVAVDASGNVYVADTSNSEIRKISAGAIVTSFAGSAGSLGSTNGTGSGASFRSPVGIAVDTSGNVYVADSGNDDIREINPSGVVITFAGTGSTGFTNGTGISASFDDPTGVAVDASGNVYVADQTNASIRKISPAGVVSTLAGSGSSGFNNGTGVAALFDNPTGLAVDAVGNVYVADQNNFDIRKITPGGVVTTLAGTGLSGSVNATGTSASFNHPYDVTVDASGNVFVADGGNDLIRKITPAGVVTTVAGTGSAGSSNATGTFASFSSPWGLAVDSNDNIFVADTNNNMIREIQ